MGNVLDLPVISGTVLQKTGPHIRDKYRWKAPGKRGPVLPSAHFQYTTVTLHFHHALIARDADATPPILKPTPDCIQGDNMFPSVPTESGRNVKQTADPLWSN